MDKVNNGKPSIISYTSKGDACFWYRNKIPIEALARDGWNVSTINMGDMLDLNNVDIVMFSRVYTTEFESFVYMLKRKGITIWYDVDDAVDLVKDFNPFSIPNRQHMSAYYFLLNEADFITTTNENLKQHLSRMTPKPIHVWGNYINPSEWKERPHTSNMFRIGFAGSPSHIKEVNMILPAIIKLQGRYPIVFVMFGMGNGASMEEWYQQSKSQYKDVWDTWEYTQEVQKFYDQMQHIKHEWHTSVRWELYPKKLAKLDLDIGVCPLIEDDFNLCKSPIKLYEYALVGTTTLASNVTPFKEEALAVTENTIEAWYEALDALMMHQELRDKTLVEQRAHVLNTRVVDQNIAKLEAILAPYERKG